jgi:MarR family transcriptional regulator for hemolysin
MSGMRVDLSFLLNQASYAFSAQLGGALAGLGISVREFCVLMKADEGEHTQNRVAELAGLDKTTMVTTLDTLEKAGLAERRVSSADRRARVIAVTPKGRRVLQKAYAGYDALVDDVLGDLEPEDRSRFVAMMTAIVDGRLSVPSHTAPLRRKQVRPASG